MRFSDGQDIDYNQLVVGGFLLDTPRKDIECAMAKFRELWTPQYREMVTKTLVCGQKAQNAHIYLQELPLKKAKERFFHLQQLYADKLPTGTGHSWMSANREEGSEPGYTPGSELLGVSVAPQHPSRRRGWVHTAHLAGETSGGSHFSPEASRRPVAGRTRSSTEHLKTSMDNDQPFLACEPGPAPGG